MPASYIHSIGHYILRTLRDLFMQYKKLFFENAKVMKPLKVNNFTL